MSNLPPGVSEHMIPGNRPEDLDYEAFWEALSDKFMTEHPEYDKKIDTLLGWAVSDAVIAFVDMARDLGYERGFADGKMEEQMAQAAKEEEAWEQKLKKEATDAQWKASRDEIRAFEEAHAQGLHDEIPRDFCPMCLDRRNRT